MNKFIDFLFNILLSDQPSILIKQNENYIFKMIPELQKCKCFNQNNKWHIYDVYEHILHVVDGVQPNIELRLAALFHDIGKPNTYTEDENGVGHFYNHWDESNKIFLNFASKNNLNKNIVHDVSNLIYYHDINIKKLDSKELDNLLKKLSSQEIKRLFEFKKSDLLAQSSKFHYLLQDYEKQELKLLKIKKEKN